MKKIFSILIIITFFLVTSKLWASELKLEIFVSEPNEINVTSPLIMGPTEMMVVAAQATKASATRLAETIKKKGLKLKYIFLTHAHQDHSQGAGILLNQFPKAKFIATPEVAALQRKRLPHDNELSKKRHGENAAIGVPAEDYTASTLDIDGENIEIWKDIIGDAGLGHPDEPHVALHIPSINTLIPSDVVYFNAHMMMGGSSKESREKWLKQLSEWIEKDFDVVVPGHMLKKDLKLLTAKGALQHSKDYIIQYDRVIAECSSADEVIQKMTDLYPEMQHRSALLIGTFLNFKQMHRLTFNPTIEKIGSMLPDFLMNWINNKIYRSKKEDYNL